MTRLRRKVRRIQLPFALTADWTTHKSTISQRSDMLVQSPDIGMN